MAYLLDSDVFMQAANLHYPFTFCPAFWDWIEREYHKNKVFSVSQVRREIMACQDALADWVECREWLFLETDDEKTYGSFVKLSNWAASNYTSAATDEFCRGADFFLIGYAHAHGHTVVTQEKHSNGQKIKIPNACDAMGVDCINTWQLLARESVRFVLE